MSTDWSHLMIPDTQCRPGIRLDYLRWAGQYAVDHFLSHQKPVRIVHIGDHWDMPSLSSYDSKAGRSFQGRRVSKDIEAGNDGFALLDEPISDYQRKNKRTCPPVDKHFLFGNHEDRVTRAIEADASVDGLLSLDHLITPPDWQRHGFLEPVTLDGVVYAHYFYNPMTGRPFTGDNLKLRLKNMGHSFTQGHAQTFDYACRFVNGVMQVGLVAGAYYVHDEDYKGPQGNAHWRGLVACHEVNRGGYDIMQVSLGYLCKRYEGVALGRYKTRHYE